MIRPLDLQTLYMNLDKVGKEAAQSRDNIHNQQITEAEKLTKAQESQKHAVARTDTGSEESTKVRADAQKGGQQPGKERRKPRATDDEAKPEDPQDFRDDRVGRHIDISG